MCGSPWKSGPSGPRKPTEINAGFSPGGRFSSQDCIFPQLVQPCPKSSEPPSAALATPRPGTMLGSHIFSTDTRTGEGLATQNQRFAFRVSPGILGACPERSRRAPCASNFSLLPRPSLPQTDYTFLETAMVSPQPARC